MTLPKWMFEGIVTEVFNLVSYSDVDKLTTEAIYDYMKSPLFVDWLYLQDLSLNLHEPTSLVKVMIEHYHIFSTSIQDYEINRWYKSKLTDQYVFINSVLENSKYNVLVVLDDLYINDIIIGDKYHYYFVDELTLITDTKELDVIYNKLDKMRDVEFEKLDVVKTIVTEIEKIMEWC